MRHNEDTQKNQKKRRYKGERDRNTGTCIERERDTVWVREGQGKAEKDR